jgi:hypothetical protein
MNQELQELGQRAVASKQWQWRRGMCLSYRSYGHSEWWIRLSSDTVDIKLLAERGAIPVLSDPATVGAICGLAGIWTNDLQALVAALEAAP